MLYDSSPAIAHAKVVLERSLMETPALYDPLVHAVRVADLRAYLLAKGWSPSRSTQTGTEFKTTR